MGGLAPGEDLLRAFVASSSSGIAIFDSNLVCRFVNASLAVLTGHPVDEHDGRTLDALFPRAAEDLRRVMRQALSTRNAVTGYEIGAALAAGDNVRGYWQVDVFPIPAGGDVVEALGMNVVEVTTRRQVEQSLHFLSQASRAFAEAGLDIEEALSLLARLLTSRLGDACVIWLLTPDGSQRYIAAMDHRDPEALDLMKQLSAARTTHPAQDWSLRSGQTEFFQVVPPAEMYDRVWAPFWPLLERFPVHSVIAVPLRVRGQVIGAIRVSRDVTPRAFSEVERELVDELADRAALAIDNARLYQQEQQARAVAQMAETRYRRLFEDSHAPIVISDEDGLIVDINPATARLIGRDRSDVIGRRLTDSGIVVHAQRDGSLREEFERLRAHGYWHGTVDVCTRDGERIPVEAVVQAIDLPAGRRYAATWRDLREQRELERMQHEFISMVTHDLKAPLSTIRGFTQLLLRRKQHQERALHTILAQTDTLERRINDLLDSARLDADRLEMERVEMDLVSLAREMVESARQTTQAHQLSLEALPAQVIGYWDRGRIGQVLENLLTNAIKYSPAGGEVRVRVSMSGSRALVSVSDQGIGIAPEQMPQLFNRFSRLRNAASASTSGVGLGLYIARSLVQAHGGSLWVESEPGVGSTFHVSLPLNLST